MSKFVQVEPLYLDQSPHWAATLGESGHNVFLAIGGETGRLNFDDARALRDWLTKALGPESLGESPGGGQK